MIALFLAALLSIPIPAKPSRYVTDNAGVLPADRANALNEKLAGFERKTSNQIIVYIDRDLPQGTTLEEMSAEAIKQWGVGQKGKDNGAILFLFTDARKMRIEVGYGLEGALPDAKAKEITSTVMKPKLKSGDYAGAVEGGIDSIIAAVQTEGNVGTGRTVAETPRRRSGWDAVFPLLFLFLFFGVAVFILILVVRGIKRLAKSVPAGGSSWSSGSDSSSFSSSSSSSDSSWSSSSSDSSSSSSFDSGGGSGGGGGSSDSW